MQIKLINTVNNRSPIKWSNETRILYTNRKFAYSTKSVLGITVENYFY